jgi:heavy metal efflux system protein
LAFSQTINLEKAQEMALQNYQLLVAQKLDESYYQKLSETKHDLPKANISSELGQFNSRVFDTKLQISQTFSLPVVYKTQRKIYQKQAEKAKIELKITEIELKSKVKYAFYSYLILKEKEKIILSADSLFRIYTQKVDLRLQQGEANRLEKTYANLQLTQIEIDLMTLKNAIEQSLQTLNYLLGAEQVFIPKSVSITLEDHDILTINQNPQLLSLEQTNEILLQEQTLEKVKQLPEISIGYSNQSIIGYQNVGNENVYFGGGRRFNIANLGVAIPLTKTASKNKILATNILIEQNNLLKKAKEKNLQHSFNLLISEKTKLKTTLDFYENHLLKDAESVFQLAKQQLNAGEINYLDWAILVKERINLKQSYLDNIEAYNNTIIEIQKLTEK